MSLEKATEKERKEIVMNTNAGDLMTSLLVFTDLFKEIKKDNKGVLPKKYRAQLSKLSEPIRKFIQTSIN